VGLFDVQMQRGEDLDWFYRARELGVRIVVLKETSIYYRRHAHSLTSNEEATSMLGLTVLRASLRRRRQVGNGMIQALAPVSIEETE
jgi:GT2 family glycosyltransferase